MNQFEVIRYYSRPEIQKAMLSIAKNREVVGSLKDGSYLSRPDTLLSRRAARPARRPGARHVRNHGQPLLERARSHAAHRSRSAG